MPNETFFNHLYIFMAIIFNVYSQVSLKMSVVQHGNLPIDLSEKIFFVFKILLSPLGFSSMLSLFFAGVFWILAMSKFDITYAYIFFSLNYVLMLFAGVLFFNEPLTSFKISGTFFAILAVILISKG